MDFCRGCRILLEDNAHNFDKGKLCQRCSRRRRSSMKKPTNNSILIIKKTSIVDPQAQRQSLSTINKVDSKNEMGCNADITSQEDSPKGTLHSLRAESMKSTLKNYDGGGFAHKSSGEFNIKPITSSIYDLKF